MKSLRFVGPHNGRELTLMLAGKKPLAKFFKEHKSDHLVGDEGFQDSVDRGLVRKFVVATEVGERRYYCLPTRNGG